MRLFVLCCLCLGGHALLAQSYTFDTDTEGWQTNADGTDPVWEATGGNPGGWISATDISSGGTWHWVAPPTLLGNVCGSYGLKLSFDLKTSSSQNNNTKPDVILTGSGLDLVFNNAFDPNTFWTNYAILLKEDAGWRIGAVNGIAPTKQQFMDVLANLEGLQIRGEYLQQNVDNGGLDNVLLSTTTFEFDLDKNDSTTPVGALNFVADTSCTDGSPVCDIDIRLIAETVVDSVVIQLISPSDGTKESLTLLALLPAPSPLITGEGTYRMTLVNNGQITAGIFRDAIKQIVYRNTAFPATPGVRLIQVSVYTACGPLGQALAKIPFYPPAYAGADGAKDFCPTDNPTDLRNYLSGPFAQNGYWAPLLGSGDSRFDPKTDSAQVFSYIAPSGWSGCPNDTATVAVRVASPWGDLGPDTTLCRDQSIRLSFPILPEYTGWTWSTGSTAPSILVNTPATYSVTVTSEINNCAFSDSLRVEVVSCNICPIYVPNVFAPNEDGRDDGFRAFAGCAFLTYHLRVFDRWGSLVFETYDPYTDWLGDFKGKTLDPGVFIWLLEAETEYLGKPYQERRHGDVTILK